MKNDIQVVPQFLTSGQCAARYNISQRHFVRLVEQGVMPKPLKLGRVSRWSIRSLEEYDVRGGLPVGSRSLRDGRPRMPTATELPGGDCGEAARFQTPFFDPTSLLRTKKRNRK